jgi:hypothetical protein
MAVLLKLLDIGPAGEENPATEDSGHAACHRTLAGGGLATRGAVMALYHHEAQAACDNFA